MLILTFSKALRGALRGFLAAAKTEVIEKTRGLIVLIDRGHQAECPLTSSPRGQHMRKNISTACSKEDNDGLIPRCFRVRPRACLFCLITPERLAIGSTSHGMALTWILCYSNSIMSTVYRRRSTGDLGGLLLLLDSHCAQTLVQTSKLQVRPAIPAGR